MCQLLRSAGILPVVTVHTLDQARKVSAALLQGGLPAIELTLTDTEDQPVLRRILMPAELTVPNPLRPGAEWSAVIPMTIPNSGPRIAGYRVLAFYP